MEQKKSVTEILQMHGKYLTPVCGTSMNPLLHEGTDTVVIVPNIGPLHRYDVPLYLRKNGQHVLHRVMRIEQDGYAMCGDHQLQLEHGITDEMILGVMEGFFRGKRYVKTTNFGYRLYVFFWCRVPFVRKLCLHLMRRKGERRGKTE
ncbi:MAG: S24/S26 family peptidase [Oscillospiraceae bacterium]|nr:S24/S26 family peptidase [Oscillospiraceae bacterium]